MHWIKSLLAQRYTFLLSIFIQMRWMTRLALIILAISIAVPALPIDRETAG